MNQLEAKRHEDAVLVKSVGEFEHATCSPQYMLLWPGQELIGCTRNTRITPQKEWSAEERAAWKKMSKDEKAAFKRQQTILNGVVYIVKEVSDKHVIVRMTEEFAGLNLDASVEDADQDVEFVVAAGDRRGGAQCASPIGAHGQGVLEPKFDADPDTEQFFVGLLDAIPRAVGDDVALGEAEVHEARQAQVPVGPPIFPLGLGLFRHVARTRYYKSAVVLAAISQVKALVQARRATL